jgi:hypothetical protein
MKFLFPVIITAMTLFAPVSLSAAEKKDDQHIKSIFFQKMNGAEVVQIRLSGKVDPKIFELGGEKPRVVLDFIETGYGQSKIRTIKAGGALVSKIRVGLHEKPIAKTRVVVDMVEGMKYSFSKEYMTAENLFRITFRSPQTQEHKKTKEQTVPIEQVRKKAPLAVKEHKKLPEYSPTKKQEELKAAEEKQMTVGTTSLKSSEPLVDKSDRVEEIVGDTATVKRETIIEENKEQDTEGVKPDLPEVEHENKPVLLDVTYEKNTNGDEMVLFHLNGFYPPVVYSAESGELFVVCDFLDADLGSDGIPVITQGGKYIRQVKVESSKQPRKVRVVIELADGFRYDVKQVFFKEDNLFVVVLSSLGEKR